MPDQQPWCPSCGAATAYQSGSDGLMWRCPACGDQGPYPLTPDELGLDPWINPLTGRRYQRCDGCGQPIVTQFEHDKACGWSVVKNRPQ